MSRKSFFKSIDGLRDAERLYHRHASVALSLAITLHFMLVTGYYLYGLLVRPSIVTSSGPHQDTLWVIPGSPEVQRIPSTHSMKSGMKAVKNIRAAIGLPIPIAEPLVDPTPETGFDPGESGDSSGKGNESPFAGEQGTDEFTEEVEPSPDEVRLVEQEPITVRQSMPGYPDLAHRLGVEGTVLVKILIDKEGIVRKVIVAKSDNSLLDDSAKAAARRWLFTPAMMTGGPVMVWAAVPFRFRLAK